MDKHCLPRCRIKTVAFSTLLDSVYSADANAAPRVHGGVIYWQLEMDADEDDDDLSARPCPSNKCSMFTLFLTSRLIVIAFKLRLKMNVMRGLFSLRFGAVRVQPASHRHKHTHEDTAHMFR